ncbi:MAG: hypothetical protein ACM3TT_07640 [Syntrophothermus sp.]
MIPGPLPSGPRNTSDPRGKDDPANHGYRPRNKEGYFPVPPVDTLSDLRSAMVITMMQAGIAVEY